jgi:CubicO group peptidase (beta-lactamase class C family)
MTVAAHLVDMSRARAMRTWAALVIAPALSCGGGSSTQPGVVQHVPDDGAAYIPGVTWRTADPAAVGMDDRRVATMKSNIAAGRYGAIDGVLVLRYGYVAVEEYYGWNRTQPHTMQSVTKSVTSLLYGIFSAEHPGAATSLERRVVDVFNRYAPIANADDRKLDLTLGDLLTMRTGMDFWEQPYPGSPLDQLNRSSGDWTRFILDRPMTSAPGSDWAYNSGAAIAICSAIREVSSENADALARRALFAPIGVTGETWFRSPFDNLPHCGGGLGLTASDLARVGYLVLRHGRWGDKTVVSRGWIDSSTRSVTRGAPVFFSSFGAGYGYFWWLFPSARGGADQGIIAASGSGGQWLFIVPALDLVAVVIATNGDGLDLLYDDFLPAVAAR